MAFGGPLGTSLGDALIPGPHQDFSQLQPAKVLPPRILPEYRGAGTFAGWSWLKSWCGLGISESYFITHFNTYTSCSILDILLVLGIIILLQIGSPHPKQREEKRIKSLPAHMSLL
jgi:hypothetical protein